jgi:hypothetical protein
MSTNLACFLFGVPTTFFWFLGLKNGLTIGKNHWTRRSEDPFGYWLITLFSGVVAFGLLVMPILSLVGLRDP